MHWSAKLPYRLQCIGYWFRALIQNKNTTLQLDRFWQLDYLTTLNGQKT